MPFRLISRPGSDDATGLGHPVLHGLRTDRRSNYMTANARRLGDLAKKESGRARGISPILVQNLAGIAAYVGANARHGQPLNVLYRSRRVRL
jgi:hypothetical protein